MLGVAVVKSEFDLIALTQLKFEQFINTSNEETRAAMYEILLRRGTDEMLNFLHAEEVDRARIKHMVKIPMADVFGNFVGVKEETQEEEMILYRTKEGIPMVVDPVTGRQPPS